MNGYYGYGYAPLVGAAPTASQLFATIQSAMTTREVRGLVKQFNAARAAEGKYGGLSGAQLDPERNPNFPRRVVVWHGINRKSGGYSTGYPLYPIGVFEYVAGNLEGLAFALDYAAGHPDSEGIYGIGFERVSEPLLLYPR
jgi:hypothetical protein